jgi:hypothetical protein
MKTHHSQQLSRKKLRRNIFSITLTFLFAVTLYYVGRNFVEVDAELTRWGYAGTFLAGLLYTYSFTAAPASAFLLLIGKSGHFLFSLSLASVGALVGDIVAYRIFRLSRRVAQEDREYYTDLFSRIHRSFPSLNNQALRIVVVVIIFVSPLPNELGNFILSRSREVSFRMFLAVSFVLNALGILVLLSLSHVIRS